MFQQPTRLQPRPGTVKVSVRGLGCLLVASPSLTSVPYMASHASSWRFWASPVAKTPQWRLSSRASFTYGPIRGCYQE